MSGSSSAMSSSFQFISAESRPGSCAVQRVSAGVALEQVKSEGDVGKGGSGSGKNFTYLN